MVSIPVDADDLILYTLNCLLTEYNSFKTSIRMRSSAISLEELRVFLLVEELNDGAHLSQPIDSTASAFVTSKSTSDSRPNDFSFGRGYGRSNNNKGGQNRGR